jgi:hypothetical protein
MAGSGIRVFGRVGVLVAAAVACVFTLPWSAGADSTTTRLPGQFTDLIEPGIPADVALRFARAALNAGLTPPQVLRILNDDRFRSAMGTQGYGLLMALSKYPRAIRRTLKLVRRHDLGYAGADSLQNAIIAINLHIRNGYLRDVGHMAVQLPGGGLVLVDVATGRQVLGQGRLGALLRAPGGGPLPSPTSPAFEPLAAPTPSAVPQPPGGGLEVTERPAAWSRLELGIALVMGLFAVAWIGYASVAVGRRSRRRS